MDEEDFVAAAALRADELRNEAMENALGLSYGDKVRKISGIFSEVVKSIDKSLEYSPNFLLLEYNRNYRLPLQEAPTQDELRAQMTLGSEIIEELLTDDEHIEIALRDGDGDFSAFIRTFTEAAVITDTAHGGVDSLFLEEEFEDFGDE